MFRNKTHKRESFTQGSSLKTLDFFDPNYKRVKEAKRYLISVMNQFENVHELIKFLRDGYTEDMVAIFNVIRSSKLFEYRGLRIASTKKILEEWKDYRVFHFPLLDDNFEEPSGEFTINIDMSEQCHYESFVTWETNPLNVFS